MELSLIMATAGLWSPSSSIGRNSTSGLLIADEELDGVSIAWTVDKASLSDSTLILVSASSPPFSILGGVGDGGDEGIDSRFRVRRFMVTLEVGSACSEGKRVGVEGGSPASALCGPSLRSIESGTRSVFLVVSTDRLRDSDRDSL